MDTDTPVDPKVSDLDSMASWQRGYAAALEALGPDSIHAQQARAIRQTWGYATFEKKHEATR